MSSPKPLLLIFVALLSIQCGTDAPTPPGANAMCSVHGIPLELGAGILPPQPPFTPQYEAFMKDRGDGFPNAYSIPFASAADVEERYTAQVQFCSECRRSLDRNSLEAFG